MLTQERKNHILREKTEKPGYLARNKKLRLNYLLSLKRRITWREI